MTGQRFRCAEGGRIDRARPLAFTFDGRAYQGFAGDTLASALVANGVRLVGRSFKYHRPRGIFAAGADEPNALVRLGEGGRTEPNIRATEVELYDGLIACSQNRWPSLAHDLGAVIGLAAPLVPSGFYYKTFMWPPALWRRLYEPLIRRAAGMGRAPEAPDPDSYDHMHGHCDVLVAGGGAAGLAAALAAGRAGARVILAEREPEFGGLLLSEPRDEARIDGMPAIDWVAQAVAELSSLPEVRLLPRTTVFGYHLDNYLCLLERLTDHFPPNQAPAGVPRQRLWTVRARQVVLAAGALERPLVFAGNDRPGVMLAGAARSYVNRFAASPGRRAVVLANHDGGYLCARDLARAGIEVRALIDVRERASDTLAAPLRAAGTEVLAGHAIVGTAGRHRLSAVQVAPLAADGARREIGCDLLCVSGGWNPAVHLFSHSRGTLRFRADDGVFVPDRSHQAERSAGACNGTFALSGCLAEGLAAGQDAARRAGFESAAIAPAAVEAEGEARATPTWLLPADSKAFVDVQNDVTAADLGLAVREGYRSIEHVKRYTTTGMGTDQGKTGNVNALAIVAAARGEDIPAVGVTTFRPPYAPVSFGAVAGREVGQFYQPLRTTPMHAWHQAHGAAFEPVGQWHRPWYYARPGETMQRAVMREAKAVRAGVGVLDATTLGKIDVQGRDAVEFLNRIYINAWTKLGIGRCRYGVMLDDQGMVMDDGVTTRLGETHFHLTTTTGGAAPVLAWLEEWLQTEWPELEVYLTSVTEQWAVIALAGPDSRKLLARLAEGIDLSGEAFPHMALREGLIAGVAARIFRISFSGELGYEINVPASYGLAVWEAVIAAGAEFALTPYGTETMHLLRAEKGYIMVGQESDGTVTPIDLGLERMIGRTKADFIGKRSLARPDLVRPDRKQLVGLAAEDGAVVLEEGVHLVAAERLARPPVAALGHVTSSYFSPNLGRSIALGLVRGGRARMGQRLYVATPEGQVPVIVTDPVFLDPDGTRLDG